MRRLSAQPNLNRPCRIYAPVGTHETLLAYLVRRLLENGANTSFVHQIADPHIPIEALIADPVAEARGLQPLGAPHPKIALPSAIFAPGRKIPPGLILRTNSGWARSPLPCSPGWNFAGRQHRYSPRAKLRALQGRPQPRRSARHCWQRHRGEPGAGGWRFSLRVGGGPDLASHPAGGPRCCLLQRAADLMEARAPTLIGLIVREAGKTLPAAIGEVREAVDFLRYYAEQIARDFDNAHASPAGARGRHQPVEFPAGDFHRADCRCPRRGQCRARQTGGGNPADRRRRNAAAA